MFDLDAYLARITLKAVPAADVDGLAAVQHAHRLAIPFENLDVILGRGIRIDSDSVFAKLVTANRGGFCFEHNRLLLDALAALGFVVRPLLARVWLGATEPQPLTHALSLVTIDGRDWIADAGFGGSYTPVMPLEDGADATAPDGARFRLARDEKYGWMLSRDGHPASTDGRGTGEGFLPQYSFTLSEVWESDLALGNHWAATAPESRFVSMCIVSIVLPRGMGSLTGRLHRRRPGENESDTDAEIADAQGYRLRLGAMFGIHLTPEEVAALGLFPESPSVTA